MFSLAMKAESNAHNGRICYHDGATKFNVSTDPVLWAAHHHEVDEGPPGSIPFLCFGLVVRTHDSPHHGSPRKRLIRRWPRYGLSGFSLMLKLTDMLLWRRHLDFWIVPINPCFIACDLTVFRMFGLLLTLSSMYCAIQMKLLLFC